MRALQAHCQSPTRAWLHVADRLRLFVAKSGIPRQRQLWRHYRRRSTNREHLLDCIKTLRVGHLMALLQIGSMPKDLAMRNIDLFAREVMPHVRDVWPGYEDRWWPSGAGS